jgi:ferredoxin
MVGGQPYPAKGFDLNLSKVWDGFVIEVGSLRGKKLLEGHEGILKEVVKEEAEALDKIRKETVEKVEKQNQEFAFSKSKTDVVSQNWESDVWKAHSETCVECGACNHSCPTCHCYFLDDVTRDKFTKLRGWDSCQYSGYAVTAGGGTPRPRLYERFRNRYFCKFKYLFNNYGMIGCTGCGRCIEGCQGKIDMRVALKDLAKS